MDETESDMQRVLHVGCGQKRKADLPVGFRGHDWAEIRLDIDPTVKPDILGTITDLSGISTASVDAVFSSHNIEHIYLHEVPVALGEFRRVLTDDGFLVITCPDLKSIAARVATADLTEPAYISQSGPITPLDMIYGHGAAIAAGHHYMAHRCGFTQDSLIRSLASAGFASIAAIERAQRYVLWAVASKRKRTSAEMDSLREQYCA